MHILPKSFVRIMHFGILSSSAKDKSFQLIKEKLSTQQTPVDVNKGKADREAYNSKQCPCCKKETMETIMHYNRRGPPPNWREMSADLLEMVKSHV